MRDFQGHIACEAEAGKAGNGKPAKSRQRRLREYRNGGYLRGTASFRFDAIDGKQQVALCIHRDTKTPTEGIVNGQGNPAQGGDVMCMPTLEHADRCATRHRLGALQ